MSKANTLSKSDNRDLNNHNLNLQLLNSLYSAYPANSRPRPHSCPQIRSSTYSDKFYFNDSINLTIGRSIIGRSISRSIAHYMARSMKVFSILLSSSTILFATFMCLVFCSGSAYCGTAENTVAAGKTAAAEKSANTVKTIGITQIVEHPALNEVRQGLLEELKEKGYIEGKNLKVIYENAQGNVAVSSQIASKLLSDNLDAAVAISTPSAQSLFFAAQRSGSKLPIIFTAVTDPKDAKLEPGKNSYPITGVTDAPNLEGLLELINAMMPNLKTLGVIYNPSEANSVSTIVKLKQMLKAHGIEIREATVNSTNDVATATQSLIGKVDALYFPQDNTVVSAIEAVVKVANHAQPSLPVILPIFTSDPILVKQGVLAAVGYDYRDIGRETGEVVTEVLGGKSPQEIPIHNASKLKTVVNKALAEKLGLKVPSKLKFSSVEVLK